MPWLRMSTQAALPLQALVLMSLVSSAVLAAACSSSTGRIGNRAGVAPDAGSVAADSGKSEDSTGLIVRTDEDAGPARPQQKPDADTTGCGDGLLQPPEKCDDGNGSSGDGCSADCSQVERDYGCPAPGKACVSTVVCGDSRVSGRERCDDGNLRDGDGCDRECKTEEGYACSRPGALCAAAKCGDHLRAGEEQCDDDDETPADGDGCSAKCRLELGWVCDKAGEACRKAVCNDGVKEGGEACDDGNKALGDGCTPFCEVEPDCTAGACRSRCGDGMILPNSDEVCDDGNLANDDGCSSDCKQEKGFSCSLEQNMLPETLQVPVTFRDFIAAPSGTRTRHPDFEAFTGYEVTENMVGTMLSPEGTPVYWGSCDAMAGPYPDPAPGTGPCPSNQQLTSRLNFEQWYRDVDGVNVSKLERLSLQRDAADGAYKYGNSAFFPWDNDARSWVGRGQELLLLDHDFGFTTEIHSYFQYNPNAQSPQVLSFTGDDDVWVFINRRLAVDIGGSHVELTRSVTLDQATAARLQLEAGKIYEMALFHAERHSDASNFNLALTGFVRARSRCEPRCGDGVVTRSEVCDDGKNDGSYNGCTAQCQRAAYCGDGKLDTPQEACDDGVNITTYAADGKPGCAPGCMKSAFCGDGQVDGAAGERCDDGKNTGEYGRCAKGCVLGPRCGDAEIQTDKGEQCDDGNQVSGDGCSKRCESEAPG